MGIASNTCVALHITHTLRSRVMKSKTEVMLQNFATLIVSIDDFCMFLSTFITNNGSKIIIVYRLGHIPVVSTWVACHQFNHTRIYVTTWIHNIPLLP